MTITYYIDEGYNTELRPIANVGCKWGDFAYGIRVKGHNLPKYMIDEIKSMALLKVISAIKLNARHSES